jgi:hypothetical protein
LDDGTVALEDLAAIPNLCAGALCEIETAMIAQGHHLAANIATPLPRHLSWKSRLLVNWMAREESSLARLTYIPRIDGGSPGIGATALKWHAVSVPTSLIFPVRAAVFG